MALPVALQLFGIRDFVDTNPKEVLKAVAEMGYRGVETCGLCGLSPEEFKQTCDEVGLTIVSGHGGNEFIIDDIENTCKTFKMFGAEYIVMAYSHSDFQPGGKFYEKRREDYIKSAAVAEKYGIRILYHNHEGEMRISEDGCIVDTIMKDTDYRVLAEPDTCWVQIGGWNAAEFLEKRKGKCPLVHIKDFTCSYKYKADRNDPKRPEDFAVRPIGYGRSDMPAILEAAENIGAKWVIVEQDYEVLGKTQLECAEMSRRWLKTIGW